MIDESLSHEEIEAQNKREIAREQAIADIREMFSCPAAVRFWVRYFDQAGLLHNCMREEPLRTAFACGELNHAQKLLAQFVEVLSPEQLSVLLFRSTSNG